MFLVPTLCLLTYFWLPPAAGVPDSLTIWEQIAGAEVFIKGEVNKQDNAFAVFSSDPVRGYYIEEQGVLLFVRFVTKARPVQQPPANKI